MEVPLHVQQLQQLATLLQKAKADNDSVTWVPDLIPRFIQSSLETVLAPSGILRAAAPDTGSQEEAGHASTHASTDPNSSSNPAPATAPTAPAPALAIGSQHLQVTSSSKRPVDWVMTTCLVPEGLPTAAAADDAGGLATMEVVCRLIMLQDCQPAQMSVAFTKALNKVRWQQYGLQYRDFFSCDDNTGILTLAVLPEAMMVPLSLIVCSCNVNEPPQGLTDGPDTDAPIVATADQDSTDPTQTQAAATAAAPARKRRRGGSNRAPPKPPTLSMRRELPLWIGALESALSSLKAQLPEGYMRGRHETILAGALPPIASSLANIIMRAANSQLREESCSLMGCEPTDLQEVLLTQLQELAAEALALRTAAAAQQQQQRKPTQQPLAGATAAAAALLAAGEEEGRIAGRQNQLGAQQQQQQQGEEGEEEEHEWAPPPPQQQWHQQGQVGSAIGLGIDQQWQEEEVSDAGWGNEGGWDVEQQGQQHKLDGVGGWEGQTGRQDEQRQQQQHFDEAAGWDAGSGGWELGQQQRQQQRQQQHAQGFGGWEGECSWDDGQQDQHQQQQRWQQADGTGGWGGGPSWDGGQQQQQQRSGWGLLGPDSEHQGAVAGLGTGSGADQHGYPTIEGGSQQPQQQQQTQPRAWAASTWGSSRPARPTAGRGAAPAALAATSSAVAGAAALTASALAAGVLASSLGVPSFGPSRAAVAGGRRRVSGSAAAGLF